MLAATDNDHSDAINKIEAELGTNPSGSAATVDARFLSVERGVLFDPRSYGAAWDGVTDDQVAIMAAVAAADAAGGDVLIPPGLGRFSDEIILPVTTGVAGARTVGLVGWGKYISGLKPLTDFGVGKYAIRSASPATVAPAVLSDFSVKSTVSTFTPGTAPVNMRGIQAARRWRMTGVASQDFYGGLVPKADHFTAIDCNFGGYYGIFWDDATLYGDQVFIACDLTGCRQASIGVSSTNRLLGATFQHCHMGFSPYGIYIETGMISTDAPIAGVYMHDCSFEQCGNGLFYDESRTTTDRFHIRGGGFSMSDTYKITAVARPAIFRMGIASNCSISRFANDASSATMPDFLFDVTRLQDFECGEEFTDNVITTTLAASKKLGTGDTRNVRTDRGTLRRANSTVTAKRLVCLSGNQRAQPNNGTDLLLGVAQNDALSSEFVHCRERGDRITVNCTTALASTERVVPDPADFTSVKALSSEPTGRVVGQLWFSTLAGAGDADITLQPGLGGQRADLSGSKTHDWASVADDLSATATWDPASLANGASERKSVTVTGAVVGDPAIAGLSTIAATGWDIQAAVIAADTVEVKITNNTGGVVDLASGTVKVIVRKTGTTANTTVTVTGAALGDVAVASMSVAVPAGLWLTAHVTAANTVTVTLVNRSGAAVDLASGTLRAVVTKAV